MRLDKLFSEMLYHSLRRHTPEQIPVLQRQASAWFEGRGYIPEAMRSRLLEKA